MKTIQIPLELAEEIIEAVEATDNRQPEWYHKLKKLVDEQIANEHKIIEVSS